MKTEAITTLSGVRLDQTVPPFDQYNPLERSEAVRKDLRDILKMLVGLKQLLDQVTLEVVDSGGDLTCIAGAKMALMLTDIQLNAAELEQRNLCLFLKGQGKH